MIEAPPSDTFFTHAPHWRWLIVFYFFIGGLAAGSFFFAAILTLFGRPKDRGLARIGYLVSLPLLMLCPPLLILDLNQPLRFWHMLVMNNRLVPIFKWWSPMSFGSWAITVFGAFVTLAFLGAYAEVTTRPFFRRFAFLGKGAPAAAIAAGGGIAGFFVAGYTGVLLSVTNRPIWADTNLVGAVFLLSAATTSAALLSWIGERRADPASVAWIGRVERWIGIAEVLAIALMVVTLGPVARVWLGAWGALLALAVVAGIVGPWVIHARPSMLGARTVAASAALALAGGFVLRMVVILSSETT